MEKLIPISSSKDNLSKFFDTEIGINHVTDISLTSKEVVKFLDLDQENVNNQGFYYGRSKFAVSNKYSYKNVQCQNCGLCHYGCPYECMFNAKNLFNVLINQYPNLVYEKSLLNLLKITKFT